MNQMRSSVAATGWMTRPQPCLILSSSWGLSGRAPGRWTLAGNSPIIFRLASVQHYLIVRTRRRPVIHHRRDGERIETRIVNGGTLELAPPGMALAIETFHSG
jgi:hypothetical protein